MALRTARRAARPSRDRRHGSPDRAAQLRASGVLAGTTWVVGAVAGAGQLGLAYGLGFLRLARDFPAGGWWAVQLTWVAWFAIGATLLGAAAGGRLADAQRRRSLGPRVTVAICAGLGAAVVLPLTALPARDATLQDPAGTSPLLDVTLAGGLGVLIGMVAATAALWLRLVAVSLTLTGGAAWLLALVSVVPALPATADLPDIRLGVLDLPGVGAESLVAVLAMPVLAALVCGGLAAAARARGFPPLQTAAGTAAAPAVLALTYLAGSPGTGDRAAQLTPYAGALIAVAVGLLTSLLVGVVRMPATTRRQPRAVGRHSVEAVNGAHAGSETPTVTDLPPVADPLPGADETATTTDIPRITEQTVADERAEPTDLSTPGQPGPSGAPGPAPDETPTAGHGMIPPGVSVDDTRADAGASAETFAETSAGASTAPPAEDDRPSTRITPPDWALPHTAGAVGEEPVADAGDTERPRRRRWVPRLRRKKRGKADPAAAAEQDAQPTAAAAAESTPVEYSTVAHSAAEPSSPAPPSAGPSSAGPSSAGPSSAGHAVVQPAVVESSVVDSTVPDSSVPDSPAGTDAAARTGAPEETDPSPWAGEPSQTSEGSQASEDPEASKHAGASEDAEASKGTAAKKRTKATKRSGSKKRSASTKPAEPTAAAPEPTTHAEAPAQGESPPQGEAPPPADRDEPAAPTSAAPGPSDSADDAPAPTEQGPEPGQPDPEQPGPGQPGSGRSDDEPRQAGDGAKQGKQKQSRKRKRDPDDEHLEWISQIAGKDEQEEEQSTPDTPKPRRRLRPDRADLDLPADGIEEPPIPGMPGPDSGGSGSSSSSDGTGDRPDRR